MSARGTRLLSIAVLVAALGFAAAISSFALFRHIRVPHHDDWFLLDEMYRSPLGSWVFSIQNGHRLPATLLLLYLDQTWAGGRMHLLVVAAQASAWISALALALALRSPMASDPLLHRTLLAFGIFALFWSGSAYNFRWGVNHGSVWTAMWLLLAVLALARVRDRVRERGEARLVLLAAGSALLATFGHGIGVATWGALFAIWAAGRMPGRVGAALAAGALVSVGLYSVGLFGSHGVPNGAGSLLALLVDRPGDLLLFVCAFAGAPFGWALNGLGLVAADGMLRASTAVGALLTLGTCAFGALAWRRGAALPEFSLAGFGLMVFVLGGGLIVGLTRLAYFGPSQAVEIRFLCWSTLFWIGGALALGGIATGRGARLALACALPALSLAMLPAFFEIRALQAEQDGRDADVVLALLLGARPGSLLLDASRGAPEVVDRVVAHLSRERRSPFGDERSGLAGTIFAERFTLARGQPCGGDSELRWRVPGGDLATVRGRLDPDGIAPAYLVLVDSKGVIRGLGEERPARRGAAPVRHWEGVIASFALHERYAAYAVLRDGRSACPVGVIGRGPGGPGLRTKRPPT